MVRKVNEIGENRYREDYGRYFEEFTPGDVYEHRPRRTVTQYDNIQYTLLTTNLHPIHIDGQYGAETQFGENLVNSGLSVGIVGGMSVTDVSYKAVANLGWKDISLKKPVFHGDTLSAETEVLEKRESKSRPSDGIVTVKTTGMNQTGEEVLEFERTILVPKEHGNEDG